MNILVLSLETTGREPDIHSIIGYGYNLLGPSLELISEGAQKVRSEDDNPSSALIRDIGIGVKELDLLDHLRTLCAEECIVAGRDVYKVRQFWEALAKKHRKMMPPNVFERMLDPFTIEVCAGFGEHLCLKKASQDSKLYDIGAEQLRLYDPALAEAKIVTEIIRSALLKRYIIQLERPSDSDKGSAGDAGNSGRENDPGFHGDGGAGRAE